MRLETDSDPLASLAGRRCSALALCEGEEVV
jgi:hypothetical protein